ncbi:hypothetical protein EV702DRAFT_1202301 [Suillus placidus]|uniref:Uncharacterized protein n=1 Tax=Suillus placidus TaxID=48579 RepID=A0A9P6ZLW7_9AGAM|nr:hypothetical protein EV702DRAFT_1202301 [Suillus placidus]
MCVVHLLFHSRKVNFHHPALPQHPTASTTPALLQQKITGPSVSWPILPQRWFHGKIHSRPAPRQCATLLHTSSPSAHHPAHLSHSVGIIASSVCSSTITLVLASDAAALEILINDVRYIPTLTKDEGQFRRLHSRTPILLPLHLSSLSIGSKITLVPHGDNLVTDVFMSLTSATASRWVMKALSTRLIFKTVSHTADAQALARILFTVFPRVD